MTPRPAGEPTAPATPRRRASAQPPVERSAPRGPAQPKEREVGGPQGPEPTRYGDWEIGGRCSDF